ncbi:MAG TPA: gliding motility-associated C-terminal domain-containing protein [Bacteroidia bacterium]|nr:gliding motility-associated C-terminal domain-containing protein [Bacteroidia bacterium]
MQENQNIEDLFKEGFNNFEEPVRPELWNNISAKIGASVPTPPSGTTAPVVESVVTASKITASVATWIAAAAVVVSGIAGYIYFSSATSEKETIEIQTPVNQDQNNNGNPVASEISNPANSAPASTVSSETPSAINENRRSDNSISSSNLSNSNSASENGAHTGQNNSQTTTQVIVPTPASSQQTIDTKNDAVVDSSPSNAETADKSAVKAYPSIGYAPLAVNFSTNGEIQQVEWDFNDGQLINKTTPFDHVFDAPGIYPVTVKTHDVNGNIHTETIKIEVLADLNIKNIPNVFTPNMDGKNDVFTFEAANITDLEVSIFDKSGKLIYKWNGLDKGWDGKNLAGQEVEGGTYFYVIFATGSGQQKHQQGGTVTLIR